jgi:glycosyltransferase involved in cell wall biosynthesis
MNIWLIQTGEPSPLDKNQKKMRTALLADKLIERGHSVLWWVSAFNHFKKDWVFSKDTEFTIKEGLNGIALKGMGYKKNISLRRFIDHRIIARKFKDHAPKMTKPDIIIASMPPHDLAYNAVLFAKENNIPILIDIRDEWPDLFLTAIPERYHKVAKILLANDFRMIKKIMHLADGLIAMIDSLLEWGLQYAGRAKTMKDAVFYLGSKRNSNNSWACENMKYLEAIKHKFVVTFIGTFVTNNNPSILIECAKKFIDKDICFVLAGDGELFDRIKAKASKLKNVLITGWLSQDEISILLKNSHVGVCPASQLRSAFPNKTFSYLSAGLPVISAFQGDLREIIEKEQIGFYYPPNDVDALVDCILKLYNNTELYRRMSENAKRVFDEMFDADKIYEEYTEHVERVEAENYEMRKLKG